LAVTVTLGTSTISNQTVFGLIMLSVQVIVFVRLLGIQTIAELVGNVDDN
jgi:hypothetical protein